MGLISILGNAVRSIVDVICPPVCLGCGFPLRTTNADMLCPDCMVGLRREIDPSDDNKVTRVFSQNDIPIEYGCCYLSFSKGDISQSIIHNIKYYQHPELGVKLGRMAGYQLKRYQRFQDVDYILPVPMHPDKQKKRGFNQAERISSGIREILGIPIYDGILQKVINSKSQTKMNKSERLANSERIFAANRVEELCQKHFLIVDDVFTTGSTLMVCARKLHEAMPECKISVFALAKA
ncbi:MAG: hypothetical protein MJZ61_06690 [Bacteroidales bacterium]|nr:hypothetical protein [Bacteroidales bacterium]